MANRMLSYSSAKMLLMELISTDQPVFGGVLPPENQSLMSWEEEHVVF